MVDRVTSASSGHHVGRYEIFDRIASGGMATVHLARLSGAEGFARVVAVKRMHPQFLEDPEFKKMFIAEARTAARVKHPNVVPIIDVLAEHDEILIVMEYVHGEPLSSLLRSAGKANQEIPFEMSAAIMIGLLQGLHAAHSARDELGRPLDIVHRDVSPHNVLLGADGVVRVLDFGIAKALQGDGHTKPGTLKGKFSYLAPELIQGAPATRRSDIFAAAIVFWELLTGRKLFGATSDQERLAAIMKGVHRTPRDVVPNIPDAIDRIVMKGLGSDPLLRYESALEMAIEIERATPLASQRVLGEWVSTLTEEVLAQRAELIQRIETTSVSGIHFSQPPGASTPVASSASAQAPTSEAVGPAPSRRLASRRRLVIGVVGVLSVVSVGAWAYSRRPAASNVMAQLPAISSVTSEPSGPARTEAVIPASSPALADPAPAPTAPSSSEASAARTKPSARPRSVPRGKPSKKGYLPSDL